jgi:GMP synthase-like glutamine amidotransferase
MRVHWLQHAEHEDLGCIGPWLAQRGHRVRHTALHHGGELPSADELDWLIVMGGPMNIYEHQRYPWLIREKALIREAIKADRRILAICLGAQLLADVAGARVTENPHQEIGWFEVKKTGEVDKYGVFSDWPDQLTPFHWHGDTFSIPPGVANLMKSDACVNQAYALSPRRVGLQFHPELRLEDAQRWLATDSLEPARYVQGNAEILRDAARFDAANALMIRLLERIAAG